MANIVTAHAIGQDRKSFDGVATVADVRRLLGISSDYQASVNTTPRDDSFELSDRDYVTFSKQVKGGKA